MKIITYPSKILSQVAEPIHPGEIAELDPTFKDMIRTMRIDRGLVSLRPKSESASASLSGSIQRGMIRFL